MIKLIAILTMVMDHIGLSLFPSVKVFRIVGRISMPLFAFCTARGFYYSLKRGRVKKYILNMLILALASQIPYTILFYLSGVETDLNICFTWLLSLLLLWAFYDNGRLWAKILSGAGVFLFTCFLKTDYEIFGVLLPLVFYQFLIRENRPLYAFVGWFLLIAIQSGIFLSQGKYINYLILPLAVFPLLQELRKVDGKICLPKRFCYVFYPVHLLLIAVIKFLVI